MRKPQLQLALLCHCNLLDGRRHGNAKKKIVEKEAWHAFSGEEVQRADRECERAAAYLSTALTRFMATARRAASNAARKEAFSLFLFFFL